MSTVYPAGRHLGGEVHAERAPWLIWASFTSACLGWMFDAMDLQLFTFILFPSVSDLIGSADPRLVAYTGGVIVACKLLAWGLGGIAFGIVADRTGRSKTLLLMVLLYSVFTALGSLAQNWWQLAILQALAGIGVGGEWAAGAALVTETWPERTRARAMQAMQMCFAFGFFLAAVLNLFIGPLGWRWVLLAGGTPAVITLFIRRFVPEPERWISARSRQHAAARHGAPDTAARTFLAIFVPPVRRSTIVGVLIASVMMIGSWGAGTLLPTWVRQLLGPDQIARGVTVTSQCFMLSTAGAVLGYLTLMWLTESIGRRSSYFLVVVGASGANLFQYTQIITIDQLLCFMPVHGFFTIGGFGVFAAYLPELFPTRIRATGLGFCWNMARVFTAAGPFVSGMLVATYDSVSAAGITVTWIYLIGMIGIWFGPETKGMPLQD